MNLKNLKHFKQLPSASTRLYKIWKDFKGLKLGAITSRIVEPFKGLLVFTNLFKMPVHFAGLYSPMKCKDFDGGQVTMGGTGGV